MKSASPTPPLVLLHGFTGSPLSFEPLDLPQAHKLLLTGHGPAPDLSSRDFGEELDRLARKIRRLRRRVHLVGYSMGARVALGLALEHGRHVCRLTLIGVNPGLDTEQEREERLAWESRWQDVLDVDGIAVFEHKWQSLPLFSSQSSVPPLRLERQRALRLSHTAIGLSHALSVLGLGSMPNLWPRLALLRVPVHLVAGALDEKFLTIAQRMVKIEPRMRLTPLEGVGHNPLVEAPEALRELIVAPHLE